MKKLLPATIVVIACFFTACQKNIDVEETRPSANQNPSLPQKLELKCLVKEDAAKSALARRNQPNTNEPVLLLLDFNGHQVNSPYWNGGVPFYAPGVPENLLPEAARTNIVKWVSEDFSAFGIKVTRNEKEYQNTSPARRMRCIITREVSHIFGLFGGIAYISSLSWGDDTPCFVFADLDLYVDRYIAEATSHELGHTFGLYHQSTFLSPCELLDAYNPGLGSGNLSWAPIMGVSYYNHLSTWHEGPADVNGCAVNQKDIDIIKSIAPLKADDHTDGLVQHLTRKLPGRGTEKGILEHAWDKDVFYKDYTQTKRFSLTSNGNSDLRLEVYSLQGSLIAAYDDPTGTNVNAVISGKRFLKIKISSLQPYVPQGDSFGGYTLNITEP